MVQAQINEVVFISDRVLCHVQYNVMVTAGANQALTSIMLTLLDPPDKAVLFRPYYFNALMALQMTG